MRRFTSAGRRALEQHNWYAALSLALIIPDICGSLEDPGPRKSKKRYLKWCREWFRHTIKVGNAEEIILSENDCFQLRNSLVHSGSDIIDPDFKDTVDRVKFFDPTNDSHAFKHDDVLYLRADKFSEAMYAAAERWDDAQRSNAMVQAEKERLLTIHSGPFANEKIRLS